MHITIVNCYRIVLNAQRRDVFGPASGTPRGWSVQYVRVMAHYIPASDSTANHSILGYSRNRCICIIPLSTTKAPPDENTACPHSVHPCLHTHDNSGGTTCLTLLVQRRDSSKVANHLATSGDP